MSTTLKFQHHNFISPRASNPFSSNRSSQNSFLSKEAFPQNRMICFCYNSKQRWRFKHALSQYDKHKLNCMGLESRKHYRSFGRARRTLYISRSASTDDGIAVNGTPQSSSEFGGMRVKLDQTLQEDEFKDELIQSLHDASRVFELAIKEHSSLSRYSWFSKAWLGVDKFAWLKPLSYQAAVYSLLQAVSEISSRGDGRDRDFNIFVQRSLLRLLAPLENSIREELSVKQPESSEWFWSQQHPMGVENFVNYFERDPHFTAVTTICWKGMSSSSGHDSDLLLLMLVLTCIAAIKKLGPAKVSCSQFFSMIPDTTGRLMDKLVDLVPMRQAYQSTKDIGLCREFLVHFGRRAADVWVKSDRDTEEITFWVDLLQKQLHQAIDREKIWSRLTTSESIEVLERDLAIFGFFIALGRSTQSFLSASGFDALDEPIESFIRYLIGGSVLYYPQLSSISSYQLYVEVVCEQLDWLPFYPSKLDPLKKPQKGKDKREGSPNKDAIPQVFAVCSYWMESFIKYSTWLENPSNIKAARFLSRGHNMLRKCMQELGVLKNEMRGGVPDYPGERRVSGAGLSVVRELDSFDKALENVEEALKRLEGLLQEMHVSSSNSGKEHLKAACSDLERIRKLKKEAEFLEASFRAKAASLQQGDDDGNSQSSNNLQRQYYRGKSAKGSDIKKDRSDGAGSLSNRVVGNPRGLWSSLVRRSSVKPESGSSAMDRTENEPCEPVTSSVMNMEGTESESNEMHRFELLRSELIELEKRVQRSTIETTVDEKSLLDGNATYESVHGVMVQSPKKDNIIGKSIEKLKETSTDVLQGTQLLAVDVAAAVGLLRRSLTGDELTEKEKQALRRTLTDLASVVPIGILMLLPVTAVGHAAILAAIQRYVPSLIPSTYAPERLDLLRQLEKVKEMEVGDGCPDENEGNGLSSNAEKL